eukprot:Plantae.Rhodophyta-Purpureofilum_apyrenoidigerum.ctg27564.p1 GENE.Plantae.Rhodophyta-Purpureofilum_apyrenoidigerum.ctg27564~~Plantae.Rhodophyta-Purpureofilum_apyrenoidigerum.ctg27564.p1  ORF type:complete len:274 (+),score=26.02 Plantae.Rhodophyta-Purpureofilum_apyrenoidigerum.ctg27564:367-1188(+)
MYVRRGCKLLGAESVPSWARIPYVLNGYRHIGISAHDCIMSAFEVHNETVNFWTHFIPTLMFLSCTPYVVLIAAKDELLMDKLFMLIYMLAATNCLAASSLYHLFGCRSYKASIVLCKADFKAISLLISASYLPALSLFFRPQPFWQHFYIIVSVIMLVKALVLIEVFARRGMRVAKNVMFVFDAAWGLIPTFHFIFSRRYNPEVISFICGRIVTMYGLYALGFTIYSARVPERFCPGRTDVLGHSHQLWHICVLLAAASWLHSLLTFYELPS